MISKDMEYFNIILKNVSYSWVECSRYQKITMLIFLGSIHGLARTPNSTLWSN